MPERGALEKSFDGCFLLIWLGVLLLFGALGYVVWRVLGGGWT